MTKAVRIGLLGCGTVGGGTARILLEHADDLALRVGAPIEIARVAVRDLKAPREIELPAERWSTDAWEVVKDPSIDVIVETIGGIDPAKELILEALASGKHVVTANKELVSTYGYEITETARERGVDVLFEAAVAGGIPIIKPMKESLAGDRVHRVMGIVNGTTNFILTRMSDTGGSFEDALAEAEELGYTEADPSADLDGHDAAAKLAILASIAFDSRVVADDVHREGISNVGAADIKAAHDLGYEVKLLAVGERTEDQISVRVHPAMLPKTHPLASVRDVFNAVFVEANEAGQLMFFGKGAGGAPTGSAVVGDLVEIARNIAGGGSGAIHTWFRDPAIIRPISEARVRFYVVLSVSEKPGVLARIAGVFADQGISIASVRQEGLEREATLTLVTHPAPEGAHQETFRTLAGLDVVKKIDSLMRVEGTEER